MSEAPAFNPALPDVNHAYQIYITGGLTFGAFCIAFALRMALRLKVLQSLGWDDLFMCLSFPLNAVANSFDFTAASNGLGRHVQFLTEDQIVQATKWTELAELVSTIATWATRTSICFFLLRIIRSTNRGVAYAIYALMALNTLTALITVALFLAQARPLPSLWDPRIPGKHFPKLVAVDSAYATAGMAALTDIFCSLSPIYFLRRIQMPTSRKVALWVLMGLGLLTCVAALLRCIFLSGLASNKDVTWAPVKDFICSMVERNAGGAIANLPILKPLFSKMVDFSTKRKSSSIQHKGEAPAFAPPTLVAPAAHRDRGYSDERILLKTSSTASSRAAEAMKNVDYGGGSVKSWEDPSVGNGMHSQNGDARPGEQV